MFLLQMMTHFVMHWPGAAFLNLWSFAVDHAIHIWNRLPNKNTKVAPIDVFTELLHFGARDLQRLHVFGCPVYVLDPVLQDGKKLPKWERKSRRAIYLGLSQLHGSNVALVLNPTTGAITPQYHLVYDDHFSTVYSDGTFDADVWDSLVASNLERHVDCPELSDGTPTTSVPSHPEPTLSNVDAELQRMFNKFTPPPDSVDSPVNIDTSSTDFPDLPLPTPPLTSDPSSNLPLAPEGGGL